MVKVREGWCTAVLGVAKGHTRLSNRTTMNNNGPEDDTSGPCTPPPKGTVSRPEAIDLSHPRVPLGPRLYKARRQRKKAKRR